MDQYIIQQEASGWVWQRESDRDPNSRFRWLWSDFEEPTSGGPFATAEEAEQDARKDQFRRFCRSSGI